MKSYALSLCMTLCLLLYSSAFALTIEEVRIEGLGGPDTLIHYDYLEKSSDLSELNFFADGIPGTFNVENHHVIKYTPATYDDNFWINVNDAPDLWAFEFEERIPAYFLIKTPTLEFEGNAFFEDGEFNYFLYENLGSMQYGVVDLSVFGPDMNLDRIGHVSIPAPEPSTFLLLGSGLAGLAFVVLRRRRG